MNVNSVSNLVLGSRESSSKNTSTIEIYSNSLRSSMAYSINSDTTNPNFNDDYFN